MVNYTIRIDDIKPETFDRLKRFLDHDRYIRYLIYKEVSDKVKKIHYQGFIELDESHVGWHKARWSSNFKDYEKGSKSSSVVKKDTYLVYVTKDRNLVLSKGCSEDYINNLETQSYKKSETPRPNIMTKYIDYLRQDDELDSKKYRIEWLGKKFIQFMGTDPSIELRKLDYYKSLIFKVQCLLIYGCDQDERYERSVERLLMRLI